MLRSNREPNLHLHFTLAPTEEELAEKKRKEYEEWMRAQELEAYRLEYDCSVKYEEHQSEKKESKSENATNY